MRLLSLMLLLSATLLAQKPPDYKPTELQQLKLEKLNAMAQVAQARLETAQLKASLAQQSYVDAVGALVGECKSIIAANKWPDTITCDLNSLTFSVKPPPKPTQSELQKKQTEKKP